VRDSGIGLSPDNLAKIFDEFYLINDDPVARNGGRSLRLAVVDGSVKLLGTKVEVESEPGTGSRFSFFVPAADQDVVTLHKLKASSEKESLGADGRRPFADEIQFARSFSMSPQVRILYWPWPPRGEHSTWVLMRDPVGATCSHSSRLPRTDVV
jgi:hypothetical protein